MDLESEAEEVNEEGMCMEYFEPEDVKYSPPPTPELLKPLHGSHLQDPIIEISSDSEEEESGPSQGFGRLSGPTPRLTGLNERQQTALLELGMNFPEDSPSAASGLQDSPSFAAMQLCQNIPSNTAPRVLKRKAPSGLTSAEKLPRLENAASSSHFEKGWKVETVGDQNFIPCPECKTRVRIMDTSSLPDHLERFHPEQDWDELRNRWHCQLCARSRIIHHFPASEVFNHMCTAHKVNLKGPMAQPAWMPTDQSATNLICPECQMKVPTMGMRDHLLYTHKIAQGRMKITFKYDCALCSLKTKGDTKVDLLNLVHHLKTIHGKLLTRQKKKAEKQKGTKPGEPKLWTFLTDNFVKCKECVDTTVKIGNLKKHFTKCHQGENISDGLCGQCNQPVSMSDILAHQYCAVPVSSVCGLRITNPMHRKKQIIHECVVGMISPKDLAKKWNCNASTIGKWVRKAGLTLPKQFKKSIHPDSIVTPSSGNRPVGAVPKAVSGATTDGMNQPNVASSSTSSSAPLSASSSSGSSRSGQSSKGIPASVVKPHQIQDYTVSSKTGPLEKVVPAVVPASEESSNNERSSVEEGEILSDEDTGEISAEQRAKFVKEALEEKLTLADLAKKYNRSADCIRGWVREAGHQLPESFNRFSFDSRIQIAACPFLQSETSQVWSECYCW